MAHYVDGFVIPLPKKHLNAYRRLAQKAGEVWRDHGALDFKECVGDDLNVKMALPFPRGIKTKPGETVLFSYIVFKSRAHRDRVNAKVMKDPRLAKMMDPKAMPFDVKRMMYGGFKTIVEA
jgi:uncharacterized protein YbaA (DUF1428 family)